MHWNLVLFTALWWAFIGTILTAAMSLGVTLSVTRAGWVRRTWRRWLQGLVLILLVFGAALVGTSGDFRTEQPAFRPEAIEAASRLLGALVVVASVYSYAFLRGWPRWTLPP